MARVMARVRVMVRVGGRRDQNAHDVITTSSHSKAT